VVELTDDWASMRDKLTRIACIMDTPTSYSCQLCSEEVTCPIRCNDCHPFFICCNSCEESHHSQLLHKPEVWLVCIRLVLIMRVY
jgi:hypothetical protein